MKLVEQTKEKNIILLTRNENSRKQRFGCSVSWTHLMHNIMHPILELGLLFEFRLQEQTDLTVEVT